MLIPSAPCKRRCGRERTNDHVRRAADLAETATTDDRLKDRLGGWQDSETRKSIYQDRETDELRIQAARERRQLRLGDLPPMVGSRSAVDANHRIDRSVPILHSLFASLSADEQAVLARRLNVEIGVSPVSITVPTKKSPETIGSPAIGSAVQVKASRERATGLEPATSSLGSEEKTTE